MSTDGYKACIHCGTPFSIRTRKDSDFCCNGCEYVHRLIRDSGFEHYYELRDRRINPVQPAALQPRDYGWLEARAAACEAAASGTASMVLDLEGISCVGCVWLIEKVFREQPGAVRIEVNVQYGQVQVHWRPGLFRIADFAREIQQFGYLLGPPGERPQEESRRLVGRIGMAAAFALNAMLFTLPRYLGMEPDFALASLFELLSLLFATLSLAACGSYFVMRGIRGLMAGVLHIDLPIAAGVVVAWMGSLAGWLIDDARFLYFDFVAIFIFLMLVGRWVQERALERNRHQLLSRNKAPTEAHVVAEDLASESNVPLEALKPGQRLRVLPGEVVPVLAELESMEAGVSLEWINGESAMRNLSRGQYVPAGAQNIGLEPLLLLARQTWAESLLARLLATRAEDQRNPRLERILKRYLAVVLLVAALGGAAWTLAGDTLTALQVVLSVLVVSCPCAIGVAYPLAQEWAILQLRRFGIFIRRSSIFGDLEHIDRILFDKTGTLTLEAPEMENPEALADLSEEDAAVLREMVKNSLHPVSRALRDALLRVPVPTQKELPVPNANAELPVPTAVPVPSNKAAVLPTDLQVKEVIGYGLIAESAERGCRWTLGRSGWCGEEGLAGIDGKRGTATELRRNGQLCLALNFREALREDAVAAIKRLGRIAPVGILSGDASSKVHRMAAALGLPPESAIGDQTPDAKAAFIASLGSERVFYIGDGANDALAFERATVRGTPATPHGLLQDKADFYFTGRSLEGLNRLFSVQRLRRRAVRWAFGAAVAYNLIVVAVALAGYMHPLLAAILMPLSSLATISLVAMVYRRGEDPVQA